MPGIPKKVIVVGAGISGATAARQLSTKLHVDPENILVLESKAKVGGKLQTFYDANHPEINTEMGGGVLTHNYPIIDFLKENDIKTEALIPTRHNTVNFYNEIKKRSLPGQFLYVADFLWQNVKFAKEVWHYNRAVARQDSAPPRDQALPIKEYLAKHKLDKIATFLEFLGPLFGYGPLADKNNYAYRYLNYMGYTTMLSIATGHGLRAVHGGYELLVKKMLAPFDVKTDAHIKGIERSDERVKVYYEKDQQLIEAEADLLVLACSPYYWPTLDMDLTEAEEACVEQLAYYPYPTVVCRVSGLAPEQLFFLEALEENGFGRPAFLFMKDKTDRNERLCTIYINLPEGEQDFDFSEQGYAIKKLKEVLGNLPGVTNVEVEMKNGRTLYPDYNNCVPWETGIALQKDEALHRLNTIHLGAYPPGSFETVGATSEYAIKTIDKWFDLHVSPLTNAYTHFRRAFQFFASRPAQPVEHIKDNALLDEKKDQVIGIREDNQHARYRRYE